MFAELRIAHFVLQRVPPWLAQLVAARVQDVDADRGPLSEIRREIRDARRARHDRGRSADGDERHAAAFFGENFAVQRDVHRRVAEHGLEVRRDLAVDARGRAERAEERKE